MSFVDKTVVITGVADGIGKCAAERFLKEGAVVIGVDIKEEGEVKSLFQDQNNFFYIRTDVTSNNQVEDLFAEVEKKQGKLDILLNIAGGFKQIGPIEELTEDQWDFVINLNLKSVYLMSKAAVPLMKIGNHGRIINMASISGRLPLGKSTVAYSCAKAGVVGFTKYMAMELGPYGITMNAVSPSTTLTPRVRSVRSKEQIDSIRSRIPVGRLAEPEDSLAAIMFLASEEASFITGITVDVTGGVFMN